MAPLPERVTVKSGDRLELQVSATDPDNNKLWFDFGQQPQFVIEQKMGDGAHRLTLRPTVRDVGEHTLWIQMRDGGAPTRADTKWVYVTVR